MSTLSQYIKTRPEKSLADWADAFGISRPYLYGLLDGSRTPGPDVALRIDNATGGEVPAASWPNIADMLDAADRIRATRAGAAQ